MISAPPYPLSVGPYKAWMHAWNVIKDLPSLQTLQFYQQYRNDHRNVYVITVNKTDFESMAAANSRLQFRLITYQEYPLLGQGIQQIAAVRHLSPLNIHTFQAALFERGFTGSYQDFVIKKIVFVKRYEHS